MIASAAARRALFSLHLFAPSPRQPQEREPDFLGCAARAERQRPPPRSLRRRRGGNLVNRIAHRASGDDEPADYDGGQQ